MWPSVFQPWSPSILLHSITLWWLDRQKVMSLQQKARHRFHNRHLQITTYLSVCSRWAVVLFGKPLVIINFKRHDCGIKFSTFYTAIDPPQIRFPCFLYVFPGMETSAVPSRLAGILPSQGRQRKTPLPKKKTQIHFYGRITRMNRRWVLLRAQKKLLWGYISSKTGPATFVRGFHVLFQVQDWIISWTFWADSISKISLSVAQAQTSQFGAGH